ncbi:MAG: hypothetical protein AB8C46_26450 [Burkholderiaceae bacterium]
MNSRKIILRVAIATIIVIYGQQSYGHRQQDAGLQTKPAINKPTVNNPSAKEWLNAPGKRQTNLRRP